MTPFDTSLAVFCMIGIAGLGVHLSLYGSHRTLEERLANLAVKIRAADGLLDASAGQDTNFGRTILRWAVARIPAPNGATPAGERLLQTLLQAGYPASASARAFQALRLLGVAGVGVSTAAFTLMRGGSGGRVIFGGVVGATLGFVGPWLWLLRRARRRQAEISRQLADVLDLLVVCVEAGLGLFDALKLVGAECERQQQAIGRELALVAGEISAGAALGQALRNLAERTAVEDLKPLAATLIQSEQLGASIGPALQASADALRTRRRLRAEEAAQKTTVKILFPLVLFVLPAMLMVIVGPAALQIMHTLAK